MAVDKAASTHEVCMWEEGEEEAPGISVMSLSATGKDQAALVVLHTGQHTETTVGGHQ